MIIRLVVSGSARIMRGTKAQAVKVARMARKHGLECSIYPDWFSNAALIACAPGYDAACNTMPAQYVPADEGAAQERQAQAVAVDVGAAWAELFPQ